MTRFTRCCMLATGMALTITSATEAARPTYRCAPTYWSRPVMAAPVQSNVSEVPADQGTYRRYSVEPGATAEMAEPVATPAYTTGSGYVPAMTTPFSVPDNRNIEMRRQRPGQGFGPPRR